jgi:ubiquinol oxidase
MYVACRPRCVTTRCSNNTNTRHQYYRTDVECKSDKIPKSFLSFAFDNLRKEMVMIAKKDQNDHDRFVLNNHAIWVREQNREKLTDAPRYVMSIYHFMCWVLDVIYEGRPIDRFWLLETVARMPYFSYVAVIHLYETLGWWEIDGDLKRMHIEEEVIESKHLRIMESLGGDKLWWNRFLARHGALVYYALLVVMFLTSPRLAYLSSELLERHAVDTYTEFFESNEQILKGMKPTKEALEYDPKVDNMYDIFVYIATDELQHANSMKFIRRLPD